MPASRAKERSNNCIFPFNRNIKWSVTFIIDQVY